MKTTLDLPDDLMRTIKHRAVSEDRKLKDLVAELLRRGLASEAVGGSKVRRRVQLPLIKGGHPAAPGTEMTPERIAQVLLDQEVAWALGHDDPTV